MVASTHLGTFLLPHSQADIVSTCLPSSSARRACVRPKASRAIASSSPVIPLLQISSLFPARKGLFPLRFLLVALLPYAACVPRSWRPLPCWAPSIALRMLLRQHQISILATFYLISPTVLAW